MRHGCLGRETTKKALRWQMKSTSYQRLRDKFF